MKSEKHYQVKEIARQLNVHPRTIQREISRGKLQAIKAGRKYLVPESSLLQYTHQPSPDIQQQIHQFCQAHKQEMITLLQKLVSIPSESDTPSHEEKLAKYLKTILEKHGLRSIVHGRNESITVQGTFGYTDQGLLFNSPLDTIPIGDPDNWSFPPFEGLIKGRRMYGRGTADCKAGIVTMIYAVLALKKLVDEQQIRIELVFDGGEQDGVYTGMKNTLKKGLPVNAGIIGYSNQDPQAITIGARGYHRYLFITHGQTAHTGARYNVGVNAIHQMIKFIHQLDQIKLKRSHNHYFTFGSRLTFSIIKGGQVINVVPDTCEAQLDVRTVPELTKNHLDKLINRTIRQIQKADHQFKISTHYLTGHEAYLVDPSHPLIQSLKTAITSSKLIRRRPQLEACGPSHIGNLLAEHHIPIIVWGPIGSNYHSYDEYIEIDSLPQAAEIYALTALNYFNLSH